ncbi:hypothetical protein SLE2022_102310 [Rubroshorea leprosula]
MDLKDLAFKIFHGSYAIRVLLRAFVFASALSVIPLLQILPQDDPGMFNSFAPNGCACESNTSSPLLFSGTNLISCIWGSVGSIHCNEDGNLTVSVVRELMGIQMLSYDARALCVGEGSAAAIRALRDLGFSNVCGVYRHPIFSSLKRKKFIHELDYNDNSLDFVFSRDLDKVSVPALLVLEIERVLRPGGIGAMLVRTSGVEQNSLVRSATPISSLLKASSIVHVAHLNQLTLVVFKKKLENFSLVDQYRLPADCPSITNGKAFMNHIEPLVQEKPMGFNKMIAYLPKFIDVSSKRRLVYVVIGAGEHLNSTNVSSWFLPSYPVDHKAFNVYFVDHNTSVMLSYVKTPGITFVYHPGLSGNRAPVDPDIADDWDPAVEDEGFDFLLWFKETVQYADFVVLKMNAGAVELKFLSDLFDSGAICFVDELFLHCSDGVIGNKALKKDCMDLFKVLRSAGLFVHQWWGY